MSSTDSIDVVNVFHEDSGKRVLYLRHICLNTTHNVSRRYPYLTVQVIYFDDFISNYIFRKYGEQIFLKHYFKTFHRYVKNIFVKYFIYVFPIKISLKNILTISHKNILPIFLKNISQIFFAHIFSKYRKQIFIKCFAHIVFLYLCDFYDNMVKKYF